MRIQHSLTNEAGIAIGPILFVVAILAILATAIAAGSSTFSSNASQETNRTNASAVIQLGQNMKLGIDRMVALGTNIGNVDINDQNTSTNTALFSPIGGGIVPPTTTLAANPSTDHWVYTWGVVTNLGNGSQAERIALLKVNQGVCDMINVLGNGTTTAGTATDIGAFTNSVNLTAWPTALNAKMTGCINSNNATNNGYYFYQVLAVQ